MITERLRRLAENPSGFIVERLQAFEGFGTRSFYSEAFALLLLGEEQKLDSRLRGILLGSLKAMDRKDRDFHWEFNNYALLRYYKASGDKAVQDYLEPLRFRNWHVTNWRLLKSVCLALAGRVEEGAETSKALLEKTQLSSGFILDEPRSRSIQYHVFSATLLWELLELTGDRFFEERFRRALGFARHFILSNGDSLYLGRGQRQIFGYACLLYILAAGYELTQDVALLGELEKVADYLEGFLRTGGFLPLVLNEEQPGIPLEVSTRDPHYPGWYCYNNYFDYLCFFGYFVRRAVAILEKNAPLPPPQAPLQRAYRDEFFLKVVRPGYEAVLALCGGSRANDMPMPYLVSGGHTLTPCYGGEQHKRSLYKLSGIPVPGLPWAELSLRGFGCHWEGESMVFDSPFGKARRDFHFGDDFFSAETSMGSLLPIRHLYLFPGTFEQVSKTSLEGPGLLVSASADLRHEGARYSASGRLKLFSASGKTHSLTLRIKG